MRRALLAGAPIAAFVAARLALPALSAEPADASLTGPQILDRVRRVYAECASYRDSGTVRTTFITGMGRRVVVKRFSTAFVRPARFRFEYSTEGMLPDHAIVWSDGKEVRTWWGIATGQERPASVSMALAAFTGVSSGSARRIPGLLLTESIGAGWDIARLRNVSRRPDATLGAADCLVIRGEKGEDESVDLWVARSTFVIRRIDEANTFSDFRTEETTTYAPRINAPVSEALLEFKPSAPR